MFSRKKKKDDYEFHLIDGDVDCWKCRSPIKVVGLLTVDRRSGNEHVSKLKYVTGLSEGLLRYITHRFPWYQRRFLRKWEKNCYVNICHHCQMFTGDFHLFEKNGAIFNPYDSIGAKNIRIRRVEMEGLGQEDATAENGDNYSSRVIFEAAKRIKDSDVVDEDKRRLGDTGEKELCKGCGSKSVEVCEGFLFYEFPVKVCSDCEWTGFVDGNQIHPGNFAIYYDGVPYFPTSEEEAEFGQ